MQLLALMDYRISFGVGVFLLWGLLAALQYRDRQDLRRNIKQIHVALGSMRRRIEEECESMDRFQLRIDCETASAAGVCRAEVAQLKQEIEAFRHSVEADINQLGEVIVGLGACPPQSGVVEQASNIPGKTALFTLRSDVDRLRAEISALQASRGSRPLPPHQETGNPRPRLPRMEQVLATLDERRGDGPPVASEEQKIVN